MNEAVLKCISGCCGVIWKWMRKIYFRIRLLFYIRYLEKVKAIEVKKAKKKYLHRPPNSVFLLLCCPVLYIYDLLKILWFNVTTSFVADKYSSYLNMMWRKDTKENHLRNMTFFFILGTLTSISFFFAQTYSLQRLDMNTLYLSLLFLFVCTICPLFSRWGKTISLLIVPISITTTVRSIIIGILVMEIHRIAWSNIDDNFDRTMKTISCDRKAISHFIDKIDFLYKPEDQKTQNSSHVNKANDDDELGNILSNIQSFLRFGRTIYRHFMYAINGMVKVAKAVATFIGDAVYYLTGNDVVRWCKVNLGMCITKIINFFGRVIRAIGDLLAEGFEILIDAAKKAGMEVKENILRHLTLKFKPNYNFTVTAARNASFKLIFRNAKQHVFRKYYFLEWIRDFLMWFIYLWILKALYQIFGVTFFYIILFLNVGTKDNMYLTQAFFELDKKKQMKGSKPLLPFYIYELLLYVPRKSAQLNVIEAGALVLLICLDLHFLFYTLWLFLLDVITYNMVIFVRQTSVNVATDLMEPNAELTSKSPFIKSVLTQDGKLMNDIRALRDEIINCAPPESPLDWDMYIKATWLLVILFTITFATPYINRTRSYICEIFFSERKPARAEWLYVKIKLERIILKAIVNLVAPNMKMFIFQKAGEINPLQNEIAFVPKQRFSFFYRTWPCSWIAKILGLVKGKPKCVKCLAVIDPYNPKAGIKCPNNVCDTYYCFQCYNNLKVYCEVCRAEIREADDCMSEQEDSSADEWDVL